MSGSETPATILGVAQPAIRILFVSDAIREPVTGVGRIAITWMRELQRQGAQVIAVDHEPNPVAADICGECIVLPCRGRSLRMGRWHLSLLRRIAKAKIPHDVLFDPTGYPNALGSHPRQVVLVHDLSMFKGGIYRPGKRMWFRAFYGLALRKAQICVCVSEHTKKQFVTRFAIPGDRCVVVPNSLDPAFAAGPADRHPDAPETPFWLTAGTLETRKNIPRLLRAFTSANVVGPLVLAGRLGPGSAAFVDQIRDLGSQVLHLPEVTDAQLRHLYRHARGLLFPSLEEGFGLPILEAMQAGLPVLTSNCTAMPEVAGDAALLVDPHDEAGICAGIERLDTDSSLRTTLQERGKARVLEFEAGKNGERLMHHIRQLCEAAPS